MVGALAAVVAAGLFVNAGISTADAGAGPDRPPACVALPDPPPPPSAEPGPTTITTLEQAYWCIFANAYGGSALDNRELLLSAFAQFTDELRRRGLDRPNAVMPALTGKRAKDWTAFAGRYQEVLATLPDDAQLRQDLAATVLKGMMASLRDDHAHVSKLFAPQGGGPGFQLGIETLPVAGPQPDVKDVVAPVYVKSVAPGSPAATAGLKPGDVIVAVNDVPVFTNGVLSPGVFQWLYQKPPKKAPVRLTLQRPATGTSWTVEITPAAVAPPRPPATSGSLLPGDIAKVNLAGFSSGTAANEVLQAIADLRKTADVRGVVLDLRGNRGGSPAEVAKLLGAFTHGKVWSSDCDVKGRCKPNRTDDSVPLLNLPLVVLTDGACASACDAFSGAVKDLSLGRLVGTRTAGIVSGDAHPYLLDDNNSILAMPSLHQVGANGETIAGIGVPPDHYAPVTAADLSAGRDPAVDKAVQLLTS